MIHLNKNGMKDVRKFFYRFCNMCRIVKHKQTIRYVGYKHIIFIYQLSYIFDLLSHIN